MGIHRLSWSNKQMHRLGDCHELHETEGPGRKVKVISSQDGILRLEVWSMDEELIFRVDIGADEAPQRVLGMQADPRMISQKETVSPQMIGLIEATRVIEEQGKIGGVRTVQRQDINAGEAALIVKSSFPRR